MPPLFHPLPYCGPLPERMNNPFSYVPSAWCRKAASRARIYINKVEAWQEELKKGKMMGVLVCQRQDGEVGFLAAYSGQLCGRADWPWMVPAVFNYLEEDGYFKQEEHHISQISQQIEQAEQHPDYLAAQQRLSTLCEEHAQAMDEAKAEATRQKALRNAQRSAISSALASDSMTAEAAEAALAALTRASQHEKAELRRLKKRQQEEQEAARAALKPWQEQAGQLRHERKTRSDSLQRWLFDQFEMMNARGERRTLTAIFSDTPQHIAPSGAGECCGPKLLQEAYRQGLKPLEMAEFWVGASPKAEVRHNGCYYGACRGKCRPILNFMLQGLDVAPEDYSGRAGEAGHGLRNPAIETAWEDDDIMVVRKPGGVLSVKGLTGEPSVEELLRESRGKGCWLKAVHRLDQATSGLLMLAKNPQAYVFMQRQFAMKRVKKEYVALLEASPEEVRRRGIPQQGTISLPLRPDPMNRPRQVVDYHRGKSAITEYEVLATTPVCSLVALYPHTGRTHQLRVHCAHQDGLGTGILHFLAGGTVRQGIDEVDGYGGKVDKRVVAAEVVAGQRIGEGVALVKIAGECIKINALSLLVSPDVFH